MSKMAHIDIELVRRYQNIFFAHFPELKLWHQWVVEQVQTKGEITTIFNRVRRFFGRPNDDSTIREAIAHEPQSMAADYTDRALLRLLKAHMYEGLPIILQAQKHDELIFRFREEDESVVIPLVKEQMEEKLKLVSPAGKERTWFVPTDAVTGWNLAFASPKNPDGLMPFGKPRAPRVTDPTNFLKMRL